MIVQNVNTCYGHPTVEGTDVEVFKIIECLGDDMSIGEISKYYNLTIYQVKEAIDWAKNHIKKNLIKLIACRKNAYKKQTGFKV